MTEDLALSALGFRLAALAGARVVQRQRARDDGAAGARAALRRPPARRRSCWQTDAEWVNPHDAVEPGTRRGADEFNRAIASVFATWDDVHFDTDRVIDDGDERRGRSAPPRPPARLGHGGERRARADLDVPRRARHADAVVQHAPRGLGSGRGRGVACARMELRADERALYEGRPSWRALMTFYLGGHRAGGRGGRRPRASCSTRWGLAIAIAAVIVGLTLLIGFVRRVGTKYLLTTQRLRISRGIVRKNVQETRLDRVQNVNYNAGRAGPDVRRRDGRLRHRRHGRLGVPLRVDQQPGARGAERWTRRRTRRRSSAQPPARADRLGVAR